MPPLIVQHLLSETAFAVVLSGDVGQDDQDACDDLIRRFTDSGFASAFLDLREVIFLDATGQGLLVHLLRIARQRAGVVTLYRPPRSVTAVLEIGQLTDEFTIVA